MNNEHLIVDSDDGPRKGAMISRPFKIKLKETIFENISQIYDVLIIHTLCVKHHISVLCMKPTKRQ